MKILWLDINSSFSHSSLAIPALDAQLDNSVRDMHQWKIVKGTLKSDINTVLDEISDYNPDLILSTAWLFNHTYLLNTIQRYKQIDPECRVILGGPEFLGDNINYLKCHPYIDAVFRGEGEEVYPKLIKEIHRFSVCSTMNGFCLIDDSGKYIDNGEAVVQNFATLEYPEHSDFFCWEKPFVQIETSRGCFNRCSFCISGNNRKTENIEPEIIEKRISFIASKGIKEIRILDRTFNANSDRACSLLTLFQKFSPDLQFHLELHPAFLSDQIKQILADIPHNLLHLEAGIQSFSDKALIACQRSGSSAVSLKGVEFLAGTGNYVVHTDLIAGLPYYSFEEIINDVKQLMKISPDEIQLELLKLLPGTTLRRDAHKYQLKYSKYPPYEILETPWIKHKMLSVIVYTSKIIDIYYNNVDWRNLFSALVLYNDIFLVEFSEYFQSKGYSSHISKENAGIILWDFCKIRYSEWLPDITVEWLKQGLSFKKGPGALSVQWKFGDLPSNPLFNHITKENTYRYFTVNNKRHWFSYNRKTNNSKSIGYLLEIL